MKTEEASLAFLFRGLAWLLEPGDVTGLMGRRWTEVRQAAVWPWAGHSTSLSAPRGHGGKTYSAESWAGEQ